MTDKAEHASLAAGKRANFILITLCVAEFMIALDGM
jgi:hypothetical protein